MKTGTNVSMIVFGDWIDGRTIENKSNSPTAKNPDRKVIRVRWDDDSETIENISDLIVRDPQ
jgi:hypothetical protein